MRVLLFGDVHGSEGAVKIALRTAARQEAAVAVQVGDFGLWPGGSGRVYLDAVERHVARYGVPLVALRGNHDDEPQWAEAVASTLANEWGAHEVRDGLGLLPRSGVVYWGGRSVAFIGGAFSIDVAQRVPGVSWWPTETPTEADLEPITAHGTTDVLLSHDSAVRPRVFNHTSGHYRLRVNSELQLRDDSSRYWVKRAFDVTEPRVHVHGHWHHGYAEVHPYQNTLTVGLANLDSNWVKSVALLDLDTLGIVHLKGL